MQQQEQLSNCIISSGKQTEKKRSTLEKVLSINASDRSIITSLKSLLMLLLRSLVAGAAKNESRASTISPTEILVGLVRAYLKSQL